MESIPPLKSTPTGTSLISLILTLRQNSSQRTSFRSPSFKPLNLSPISMSQYRSVRNSPPSKIPLYPGGSFLIPR